MTIMIVIPAMEASKSILEKLNNHPRKRFNFETPNYMFNQKVAFVT